MLRDDPPTIAAWISLPGRRTSIGEWITRTSVKNQQTVRKLACSYLSMKARPVAEAIYLPKRAISRSKAQIPNLDSETGTLNVGRCNTSAVQRRRQSFIPVIWMHGNISLPVPSWHLVNLHTISTNNPSDLLWNSSKQWSVVFQGHRTTATATLPRGDMTQQHRASPHKHNLTKHDYKRGETH